MGIGLGQAHASGWRGEDYSLNDAVPETSWEFQRFGEKLELGLAGQGDGADQGACLGVEQGMYARPPGRRDDWRVVKPDDHQRGSRGRGHGRPAGADLGETRAGGAAMGDLLVQTWARLEQGR
jgi:hypothetical protein